MKEKRQFLDSCLEKLEILKKEETFLREILRDVQKQLGKYKVEALYISHVNVTGDDDAEQENVGDNLNSYVSKSSSKANEIDCPDVINENELDLAIESNYDGFIESEDSDISD